MVCCIALHQVYNLTNRHCWFCLYHIVNVAFICFHISYYHTVSLTYLIRKLFYNLCLFLDFQVPMP